MKLLKVKLSVGRLVQLLTRPNQPALNMRYSGLSFLFTILCLYSSHGQEIIPIETKSNAVVFMVNKNQEVSTIYFGKRLTKNHEYDLINDLYSEDIDYTEVYNSIYTPSGSKNLLEPAISVVHYDGNTSLSLRYVSHSKTILEPGVSLTQIVLKDPIYAFEVSIFFKTYDDFDVVEQWSVIHNKEKGKVLLKKYASANLYIRGENDFWLKHYHGDWAKEMQPEETRLTHGIKVLDSKLGARANLFQPPIFMIGLKGPVHENKEKVILAGLEWSGNFKTEFEVDPLNNLRIISGINSYSSEYELKKSEKFETPKLFYTLSNEGLGKASRNLHNWARKHKILDGNGDRLTLLNNWEATYFDFDEDKIVSLIESSKKLGVDLFLLDDGWFGNKYPRNGDNAALGDWEVNKKKLPNGIGTLVNAASENDVTFGIWIEPEMVNPKSELYEKHPEWIIKQPKRPEHYFRNQLVLDLSNDEVQDFVLKTVDDILTQNPEVGYIKWDCNAVIYNAHSSRAKNKSHLYVDYVHGLYTVLEKVREKYPSIPMMLCSGGGGRVDYKALTYFNEFWPSDNTDPLERIFMQWEYSYFYPSLTMSAHITNWGKQSLKFKMDVAMMGKLGFDIVVEELDEPELEFCQKALSDYGAIKKIVWHGDQYRLQDPWNNDIASVLFVGNDKNSGIMFNYLVDYRYGSGSKKPIKLNGLDKTKTYDVEEINVFPNEEIKVEKSSYSGEFLMTVGINPKIDANYKSVVLRFTARP